MRKLLAALALSAALLVPVQPALAAELVEPVSCVTVSLPDSWQLTQLELEAGTPGYLAVSPDQRLVLHLARFRPSFGEVPLDAVLADLADYYTGTIDRWYLQYAGIDAGLASVLVQADSPLLFLALAWQAETGGPSGVLTVQEQLATDEQGRYQPLPSETVMDLVGIVNSVRPGCEVAE